MLSKRCMHTRATCAPPSGLAPNAVQQHFSLRSSRCGWQAPLWLCRSA